LHEEIRQQIQHQTERYIKYINKRKREVIFNERDLVWLHLRKERFPKQRKFKLNPHGDGPFQILRKVNNNSYQLDLPEECGLNTTFNVTD